MESIQNADQVTTEGTHSGMIPPDRNLNNGLNNPVDGQATDQQQQQSWNGQQPNPDDSSFTGNAKTDLPNQAYTGNEKSAA